MVEIKLHNDDCLKILKTMQDESVDSIVTDAPYGINMMGKKWDYDVPSVEIWKECFRVLKSGGHILVACGTRTQHRMVVNIEDAGFQIRDLIAWIYSQGFPKNVDISKYIDKSKGTEKIVGKGRAGKTALGQSSDWNHTNNPHEYNITEPNSPESKEWEGWGTALKPSMELWTLARKPLSEKTIVNNVLKHGTGGINIDDCRIDYQNEDDFKKARTGYSNNGEPQGEGWGTKAIGDLRNKEGRFPANVIHDGSDEVIQAFPNTSPNQSASRFFYCAKASKSERNAGLDNFIEQDGGCFEGNADMKNNRKIGADPTKKVEPTKNNHPTVKPIKLMEYLCRLITKPNGVCMDIFMGSGTTGIACQNEGFNFIGIEIDPQYFKIAKARIEYYSKNNDQKNLMGYGD